MIPSPLASRIESTGIVAVLVIDREEDGPPLAKALLAGGVDVMELTLRTPAASRRAPASLAHSDFLPWQPL